MRPILIVLVSTLIAANASAGMPSPLPENPEQVFRLGDTPLLRLQTFSFFLFVFLLSATLVKVLWNYVRKDIPVLPRLTFGRAVVGVFLWGLLFVIVLTMISGARELMTPGAWKKQGFTYKLATDPAVIVEEYDSEMTRRKHLEKLRTSLWQFAAMHNGRFPNAGEVTAIPTELWELPDTGHLRFLYRTGLTAQHVGEILAYEPELVQNRRLVLQTNGDIVLKTNAEIHAQLSTEKMP